MSDLPQMCPWCGQRFSYDACTRNPFGPGLIPEHDYGAAPYTRVCPGSNQNPRNAEADKRPLWKDGGVS